MLLLRITGFMSVTCVGVQTGELAVADKMKSTYYGAAFLTILLMQIRWIAGNYCRYKWW